MIGADLNPSGCREQPRDDGTVALDFWFRAEGDERDLAAALSRPPVNARIEIAPEGDDWRRSMRAFHRPLDIGPLRLRPPWEAARAGALDVVVDPGMAFGTGQHPTTRSCLDLLVGRPQGSLLDAGCGSGVLAIAAARLGHAPVIALDDDPDAVAATRQNALANGVSVETRRARIGEDAMPPTRGVVANLTATAMAALATALGDAPPEWLIVSGLREFEARSVLVDLTPLGLREDVRRVEAPWVTLLLTR